MTKKDYKIVANSIAVVLNNERNEFSITIAKQIADELARQFAANNSRFNANKFYEACGIK